MSDGWSDGASRIGPGDRVRDEVSRWEGAVTAKYVYWNGCVRYEVSGADKDGKPESFVFDEQQLTVVAERSVDAPGALAQAGGPRGSRPVPR